MVIYTPVPIEDVLKDYDKVKELKEINYQGRKLQVETLEDGRYKIVRIISSSPQDYLNPRLQPGLTLQNEILEG